MGRPRHCSSPAEDPPSLRRVNDLIGLCLRGRYRVERLIREGSKSVIYQASDTILRRRVALKVISPGSAAALERFAEEARLHARLHHPHIPELLDLVEEGPLRVLVMEHVDGADLDDLLLQLGRPMGLPRLRALITPITEALAYLHSQQVVHRDVKPANIIIYEHHLRERSKLLDFGVARQRGARAAGLRPDPVTGTLAYMSPEQFTAPDQVDQRSDIYALGVTLFQMATGTLPFYAREPRRVMRAHLEDPPPLPRGLNPEVSLDLEELILRALQKDPAHRPQHMEELGAALHEAREQPGYRWKRWRRRISHRWLDSRRWLSTTEIPDASGP